MLRMIRGRPNFLPYLEKGWWKEVILLYLGLMNLEMKKRSNDIVCEMVEKSPHLRIQLLGARALNGTVPISPWWK
jgi:hypothetical protein